MAVGDMGIPSVPMGSDWLTKSRAWGEVDSPTQVQPLMAPIQGNPQQWMQMLQDPAMQEQLQRFGINFNPSQVQQSPYFQNDSFMGRHPGIGNRLSGAMSNIAMTPSANGPEGFGGGMSRAMQGMAGGPEMTRQFQLRQLASPFQAMGMTIPGMEFQRKQEFLEGILADMRKQGATQDELLEMRRQMEQQQMQYQNDTLAQKNQQNQDRLMMSRPVPTVGGAFVPHFGQPAQPGGQQTNPMIPGSPQFGNVTQPTPGRPEEAPSWGFQAGAQYGQKPTAGRQGGGMTDEQYSAGQTRIQQYYGPLLSNPQLPDEQKQMLQQQMEQELQDLQQDYSQGRAPNQPQIPPHQPWTPPQQAPPQQGFFGSMWDKVFGTNPATSPGAPQQGGQQQPVAGSPQGAPPPPQGPWPAGAKFHDAQGNFYDANQKLIKPKSQGVKSTKSARPSNPAKPNSSAN